MLEARLPLGGELRAENRAAGGACFVIELPAASADFDCTLEERTNRLPFAEWVRHHRIGRVARAGGRPDFPEPGNVGYLVLPAGARVAYETGARDVSLHQQLWIQEGTIEVTMGKVTYTLAKDDCLAMQLEEPITFRNRTRKAARYIVVLASERPVTARR